MSVVEDISICHVRIVSVSGAPLLLVWCFASKADAVHTFLRVDLGLDVEIDARDDDVGEHVDRAHAHQDVRVVKGYLLRDLHHPEDDDQVGAVVCVSKAGLRSLSERRAILHLRAKSSHD